MVTVHMHLFLQPVNIFIRFKTYPVMNSILSWPPKSFKFIVLKNMANPLNLCATQLIFHNVNRQACKCELVRDRLNRNPYTFLCYHGAPALQHSGYIQSSHLSPYFPPGPPLFLTLFHYNKLSISLSLQPLSVCLPSKSKQAIVEQPCSLAPLA